MGAIGFFPETYVDVIRTKERSSSGSTHSSLQAENQLGVSPASTTSIGSLQATKKGCEFG